VLIVITLLGEVGALDRQPTARDLALYAYCRSTLATTK